MATRRGGLVGLVDRLVDAGAFLAAASVVAILVLVCAEVAFRAFSRSTMIADEISGYLHAAIVFLGMAYTLREGGFIRVELLYDRMPAGLRRAADLFSALVSLAFVAAVGWFMWLHVQYAWQRGTRAVSVLQTPEYIPQSLTLVGAVLLGLQLLVILLRPAPSAPPAQPARTDVV